MELGGPLLLATGTTVAITVTSLVWGERRDIPEVGVIEEPSITFFVRVRTDAVPIPAGFCG